MWINDVYHRSIHNMTGRSPSVMWQDAIIDIKRVIFAEIGAKFYVEDLSNVQFIMGKFKSMD